MGGTLLNAEWMEEASTGRALLEQAGGERRPRESFLVHSQTLNDVTGKILDREVGQTQPLERTNAVISFSII